MFNAHNSCVLLLLVNEFSVALLTPKYRQVVEHNLLLITGHICTSKRVTLKGVLKHTHSKQSIFFSRKRKKHTTGRNPIYTVYQFLSSAPPSAVLQIGTTVLDHPGPVQYEFQLI